MIRRAPRLFVKRVRRGRGRTDSPVPPGYQAAIFAAVFLVLTAIFFWRVIFSNMVLLPGDMLFSFAPWRSVAPSGYSGPANYLLFDQVFQIYPWFYASRTALAGGRFPFWNDSLYCGYPSFAELEPAVFYPLNWFLYLFHPLTAAGLGAILKVFLAGLGAFLFARIHIRDVIGPLFASIAFAFCGFLIVWLGHPHSNPAIALPWIFLTTEMTVSGRGWRGIPWLALATGAMTLGGHPETGVHILAAAFLYAFFRSASMARSGARFRAALSGGGLFSAGVLLGIAVASIQIIPFIEYLGRSSVLQARSAGHNSILPLRFLLNLIVPDLFGNPLDRLIADPTAHINYNEWTGFVGILPLFLTLFLILHSRPSPRLMAYFFTAVAGLSLSVIFGMPGISHVMAFLPGFSVLSNNRLFLVFDFCIALTGGLGARDLLDDTKGTRSRAFLPAAVILTAAMIFGLIMANAFLPFSSMNLQGIDLQHYRERLQQGLIRAGFVSLSTCAVFALRAFRRLSPAYTGSALCALLVIDLFSFGMDYNPTIERERVYPETPSIEFLQKQTIAPFRILGMGMVLPPNVSHIYDLQDIRGFNTLVWDRYERLITGRVGHGSFYWMHKLDDAPIPPLLKLMNVGYVFFHPDISTTTIGTVIPLKDFIPVYDKEIRVFQYTRAYPRAFPVHNARIDSPEKVLWLVQNGAVNFRKTVLLEEAPPLLQSRIFRPGGGGPQRPVGMSHVLGSDFSVPGNMDITVEMASAGFLFISETWDPGWRAAVDGVPAPVLRANYVFQAVPVPQGRHRLVLTYRPPYFIAGVAITSVTLVLLLVVIIIGALTPPSVKN